MKTLFLILISVSSLFAQVRKKQTTEYLTITNYRINDGLQKPFKVGYLAYTPDSYYLNPCMKYPLIIACHGNGQKGTGTPDATINVIITKNLIRDIKKCDTTSTPKVSYYPSGGHDGAWSNGMKTDSVFKYLLIK